MIGKFFLVLMFFLQVECFAEEALPRNVIALFDSKQDKDSWFSNVLQYAAMPIEQQGLVITYHDIQKGFPDLAKDPNILGAVVWELELITPEQDEEYLDWAIRSLEANKKLAFLGTTPADKMKAVGMKLDKVNKFWKLMGLDMDYSYEGRSFGVQYVYGVPFAAPFEREYFGKMPTYLPVSATSDKVKAFVSAKDPFGKSYLLVATTPSGGYVASEYGLYKAYFNDRDYIQWYINPFVFFKEVFQTEKYPKPDTTTLAGRRIYYSHIDGDGWNSMTLVEGVCENKCISAKVILKEIIAPNPELPITVAPIAADLDPAWVGLPQAQEIAKELFSLEQVEIGSHTYSHPFDWGFFKDYNPNDEKPYLDRYPFKTWEDNTALDEVTELIEKEDGERKKHLEKEFHYPKKLSAGYELPRAYANKKFNIVEEIEGSAKFINRFCPPGKETKIIQWSGNCIPFEEALDLASKNHLKNINGGDTRFDWEFDSYAWVRPLGRNVGPWRQVFSSMSNENLYTDLWTKRFYGFNRLPRTLHYTETPIRLRPINLYFHMYSGEKFASLNALKQNIEYIKSQEIIPIKTSNFTDIVDGYHTAQITPKGENRWSISNRGALQTVRFDEATFLVVDLSQSVGVIGQRHHQGSLYVALDENVEEPLVALKEQDRYYDLPQADDPYLIESRWRVWKVLYDGRGQWSFEAKGYGDGEMSWYVPDDGEYEIRVNGKAAKTVGSVNNILEFVLTVSGMQPLKIMVQRKGN